MSRNWLQKKRKNELVELARSARLPEPESLLKDDLVASLARHLNDNETTYAKQPSFRDYYGRSSSPLKTERSSPLSITDAPPTVTRSRRRTLIHSPEKEKPAAPSPDKSVLSRAADDGANAVAHAVTVTASLPTPDRTSTAVRTPRTSTIQRRVSEIINEVDIPASPAQLAEVADQSLQAVHKQATELWARTRIDALKEAIRESASSVAAIQTLILFLEAGALQWNTLAMTPAIPLPEAATPYTSSAIIRVPDGWALLTAEWWAPATLWALTSLFLPLAASYFVNLSLRSNTGRKSPDRQYPADPLTFNIVKALLAYSAFSTAAQTQAQNKGWGPFDASSVSTVRDNVPGGYHGLLISSCVGVLASLYDAALKG